MFTQLTAENEQLKESLKRVTSEKEQIEATYRNASQHRYHQEQHVESSNGRRTEFERITGDLIEKARLDLVREEVERQVAERMKQLKNYTDPMKSLTKERSLESAEIVSLTDQAVNLGECTHHDDSV